MFLLKKYIEIITKNPLVFSPFFQLCVEGGMGVLRKGVARVIMERGLSASECPVCYDRLGTQRVPYSLLCGHTLCGLCIKNLSHGSETFPCPLCRELTPVNNVKVQTTFL